MRVCLIYDCLYPWTIGGAERWYRNLAVRLVTEGHEVTYVTMRQWEAGSEPQLEGVEVVPVTRRMPLYVAGRRRILPPLVFGLGVFRHLLRCGSAYDVVHTASFPYFSLIAASLLRKRSGYRLIVDWHEVWTRDYWLEYLGPAGRIGWAIQQWCISRPQTAFCFSRLHAARLRTAGMHEDVTVLRGQYEGPAQTSSTELTEPLVVFVGRHIPEKRVTSVIPAFLHARSSIPDLRCVIFGQGPDRAKVLAQISQHSLEDAVAAPGFVSEETVEEALRAAMCLVLPSRREGYGLVVLEAAARGTPSVVVDGPDNAAVEFIENGVNGVIAPTATPTDLGDAIRSVAQAGQALRLSARRWFDKHHGDLSLDASLGSVVQAYVGAARQIHNVSA